MIPAVSFIQMLSWSALIHLKKRTGKRSSLESPAEGSYENPEGNRVTCTYRGLHDLNVIHGDLEHGTELIYSEQTDMDERAIEQWISPKEELGIFAPIKPCNGLDYRAAM